MENSKLSIDTFWNGAHSLKKQKKNEKCLGLYPKLPTCIIYHKPTTQTTTN